MAKTIATHSGSFHADDVFGVAVLKGLYPTATILRTREPQLIQAADFAVDVGGEWDAERGRFDHHQKGFSGKRLHSGVGYASAGLVWASHGGAYLRTIALEFFDIELSVDEVEELALSVDTDLVQHLDRADTGTASGAPGLFGLSALISQFNLTREESAACGPRAPDATGEAFDEAVELVQTLMVRIVRHKLAEIRGNAKVRAAEQRFDGRVLVLPASGMSWEPVVCAEMPGVLFVVYPDSMDAQFQVRTVPVMPRSFDARLDLPAAWSGLRDGELAAVSGVADAVFCHTGRFIAGAVSLEGALELARLALVDTPA